MCIKSCIVQCGNNFTTFSFVVKCFFLSLLHNTLSLLANCSIRISYNVLCVLAQALTLSKETRKNRIDFRSSVKLTTYTHTQKHSDKAKTTRSQSQKQNLPFCLAFSTLPSIKQCSHYFRSPEIIPKPIQRYRWCFKSKFYCTREMNGRPKLYDRAVCFPWDGRSTLK